MSQTTYRPIPSAEECKQLTQEAMDKWATCVGPGWHDILRDGFRVLYQNGWDGAVHQIKEKFGTLRFYAPVPQGCEGIQEGMEWVSGYLCEVCGERGYLCTDRSWYLTLCKKHHEAGKGKLAWEVFEDAEKEKLNEQSHSASGHETQVDGDQ